MQRRSKLGSQINSSRIVGEAEHDLWSSVPPRGDIFGHEPSVLRSRIHVKTSGQAEVANFQFAVRFDQMLGSSLA
jgi:hypothetical protein